MTTAERRVRRATRIGLALGGAVFVLVLSAGRASLLPWSPAGDFYDEQARALLDGHLDMDPEVLSIEAFFHDGRAYMYQPPFPALLRLPVEAVTDDLDGRLGAPSMLLAALVLAVAVEHLVLEGRRALRLSDGTSRLELGLCALLGAAVLGGATPVFLASRAWVYHESSLWGLAWTVAALAALLRVRRAPSWPAVGALTGCTLAAVLSRASVGLGAVVAAGLLALVTLRARSPEGRWRSRLGGPGGPAVLALAAMLPVVAYAAINLAKFGTLASVPFDQQGHTLVSEERQAVLAANGGTLFGPQFAPTTLWHYLRPTGLSLTRAFPFVDFAAPDEPIGDVRFDLVDRTASIPTSLPGFLGAAVVGVAVLWRARRRGADRAGLAVALVGAGAGALAIIPFGYVAERYLADVLPVLLVGGVIGVQGLAAWHPARPSARPLVGGLGVLLVVVGAWVNVSLAARYQRLYAPNPRPVLVAELVRAQTEVGDLVGGGPHATPAARLPAGGAPGALVAVGDCAGLYAWSGATASSGAWVAVERSERAGRRVLQVDLARLPEGRRFPLAGGAEPGSPLVWVRRDGDDIVGGVDGDEPSRAGRPQPIRGRTTVDVVLDPYLRVVVAYVGDQPLTSGTGNGLEPGDDLVVGESTGRAGIERTTPGLRALATDEGALCRRMVAR